MKSVSAGAAPPPTDGGATGPSLVGRDGERASLDAAWRASRSGHGTLVLLDGPAGFGKTLLAADLLARRPSGLLMRACGEPDEAQTAYGVLGQLVRTWPGELPLHLAALARGRPVEVDPLAGGVELLTMLDELGDNEPGYDALTILVDDAQWADPQSLRALAFAIRRAQHAPVLTVLACRTESLETLPPSLRRLADDDAVRITLGGFGAGEVGELAAELGVGHLHQRDLHRIAEHTDGSPLHARAVLAAIATGATALHPGQPLPVPDSYARLVEASLAACPPASAELVRAASVAMLPRPLPLVAAVAGVANPLAALDGAVAAGLLRRADGSGTVRLTHPLARAAVYRSLSTEQRADLHVRYARELDQLDELAALRHRVAAAAGPDPDLAARAAARAETDHAAHAWDSAARWYAEAARLAEPGREQHRDWLLRQVEAVVLAGDVAAVPALRAQLEPQPASAMREYLLARLRTVCGDLLGARELAGVAWELLDTASTDGTPGVDRAPGTDLAARIAAELARTTLTVGQAASAFEWAQRAIELTPPGSDAGFDSRGTQLLAVALQGRFEEALAPLAGLPAVIADPGPGELDAMIPRGMLSLWNGDLDQAVADLSGAVHATRVSGPIHLNLGASAYLSDAAYRAGDWDTAISEAETALALALDLDHTRTLPMLYAAAASPLAARGEFERAGEHVTRAIATAGEVGDMQTMLWAHAAAGRLGEAQGDPAATLAALGLLHQARTLDGPREPGLQPWQCEYAAALVQLGRIEDARRTLDEVAAVVEERGPARRLPVLRVRAELALAAGDVAEARAQVAAAGPVRATVQGHPFELARFDLTSGIVLGRAGEQRASQQALREASTVFSQLRAAPWLARANEALRGSHATAPATARARRGRTAGRELTAAETAVVRLVAEGMTNREIAAHLVVSVKTVEYHLSNIFAKAGVRSRTQLAALYSSGALFGTTSGGEFAQ